MACGITMQTVPCDLSPTMPSCVYQHHQTFLYSEYYISKLWQKAKQPLAQQISLDTQHPSSNLYSNVRCDV